MSDPRETLADEVVRTAMTKLGHDTPVGFWAPTENATRKAITAVLRELASTSLPWPAFPHAAMPERASVDALADEIEGVVEAPTTNPEPPAPEPESYTLVYWQFGSQKTRTGTLDDLKAEVRDMAEKEWAHPEKILDPDGNRVPFEAYQ